MLVVSQYFRRQVLIMNGVLRLLVFALYSWLTLLEAAVPPPDESPVDLVSVFKQAICSSRDVEYFLASQTTLFVPQELQAGTTPPSRKIFGAQVFEGARSGTNFYIRAAEGWSNKMDRAWTGTVVGQVGSNSYQMNQNSVLQTSELIGSNPAVAATTAFRGLVNQFLRIGLGDVEPGSVVWQGDEFSGTSSMGYQIFGLLTVSNGVPVHLQLSQGKGGPTYKSVAYTYPNPHAALAGFPSRMVISTLLHGTLQPQMDLAFHQVRFATRPILESAFSYERFAGSNILDTNEYADGHRYWVRGGKKEVMRSPQRAKPAFARYTKVAILASFVAASFGVLPFLKAVLGYLLVGSYGLLAWKWLQERRTGTAGNMLDPAPNP